MSPRSTLQVTQKLRMESFAMIPLHMFICENPGLCVVPQAFHSMAKTGKIVESGNARLDLAMFFNCVSQTGARGY